MSDSNHSNGLTDWLATPPPPTRSAACFNDLHDDCRTADCPCECGHEFRELLRRMQAVIDVDRAIDPTNAEVRLYGGRLPPDFQSTWATAPQSIRHGCEMDSAEYFFLKGRQTEQEAAVLAWNALLKADVLEMRRLAKERLAQ